MQATVFFKNIRSEIISNLKKANKEIKVAVAWLIDEDIIRVLTQQADKGLRVQVVISEAKENFKTTSKYKEFIRVGGKLYIASPKFLHHKFCIIDSNVIINGSYNWTYNAQSSDENILVITVAAENQEDSKLLKTFEVKHKFFCDKASVAINELGELNRFKEKGWDAATALAQLDEEEIKLRQELEDDVRKSFDEALRIGISISPYLLERMKLDGGGVEFIKRILHDEITSNEMKSGFRKLEEPIPPRVDLSLEFLASRPKYNKLFNAKEVEFCNKLMVKYKL
jgi:hypothetical protein